MIANPKFLTAEQSRWCTISDCYTAEKNECQSVALRDNRGVTWKAVVVIFSDKKSTKGVPCTVSSGDVAAVLVHEVQSRALLVSLKQEQGLVHHFPFTCMYCSFPVICDLKNLMACSEVILETAGSPYGHSVFEQTCPRACLFLPYINLKVICLQKKRKVERCKKNWCWSKLTWSDFPFSF